jgi:protein-tyrosine phosphatase
LLTNALYRHEPGATAVLDPDVMAVVWRVQAGYLQAAFQTIDSDFGSMAQYLELRLGLTPQAMDRLRQTYLD